MISALSFFRQVWADIDHIPPARHSVSGIRPDLALVAMNRILRRSVEEDEARLETALLRKSARAGQITAHRRRHVEALEREWSIGLRRSSSYADCGGCRCVAHASTVAGSPGSPTPLATSASATALPSTNAPLSSARMLAGFVDGPHSRLKSSAATRREGLEGLVIPRHAPLGWGDRGGSTGGVATAMPHASRCSTAHSRTQSCRPLGSSTSTPAIARWSPHKRPPSPLRIPLPPSALERPRSPSPQRASAGFRLAAERGISPCEPTASPGRVSTGLPIHGSTPVHHIERVLAATGTASHAVIAMLAAPTLSCCSPTGAKPPTLYPKAELWLRQKRTAMPARQASQERCGHSERCGDDTGRADGQGRGDSTLKHSGHLGGWPSAGTRNRTVPAAEETGRSVNEWPSASTSSAQVVAALLEGLTPSLTAQAAKRAPLLVPDEDESSWAARAFA
jgi:hypothetical protein